MAVPSGTMVAITIISCLLGLSARSEAAQYLGKFLGKLTELNHGVSGEVYAVDARTLHIKDFTYDGQGPAAYFFAGNSRAPGNAGFRVRDENGSGDVLRRYRKEGVTITLPEGKSLNSIKWFSVWCEEFEVNFGDVKIPKNFEYPRPQKIEGLRGVHGVSSDNIVVVDAQTLLIPNLSYDGEAPDAKFWVGRGPKPSPQGIRVPDENGKENPLRRYDRKTVVLTLPSDLTVFDIGHFGIWCEAFTVDFGHVQIPQSPNVPPSLKMLGVSPQSKLNCEVLHDDLAFEVRWAVAGDSIVLQLVARLENREYMSFGISGDSTDSLMIGGDVGVASVDHETLKGFAEDYFLADKSQCSGRTGSCPDSRLAENANNIRTLNAAMVNGYSIVTYQRPLRASDQYDKQIFTNQSQPVIWAIGPLNQRDEVSFHSVYNKRNRFIDFGRAAKWNCPMPEGDQPSMKPATSRPPVEEEGEYEVETPKPTKTRNNERRRGSASSSKQELKDSEKSASRTRTTERRGNGRNTPRPVPTPAPVKKTGAWFIPPIQCNEPEDGVFFAQMGPTGGKHGYPAITGHVGWGISWYINGLLIPEINVVRGKSYNFVVEGGFDPEVPAKYHPFYITDDPVGGYAYKNPEEQKNVKIFAGAKLGKDGTVHPTGVGRLCHWTHEGDSDADDFDSFGAYQRTLKLKCDLGEPGVIQWTPDKNTPDTVYYQCFTHRYLGWKINVLDSCDIEGAASEIQETKVLPEDPMADLADSPSIRIETRIKPNDIQVFNKDLMTSTDKIDNLDAEENTFTVIDMNNSSSTPQILTVQELPKLDSDWSFKTNNDQQLAGYLGKTPNHTITYVQLLPPMKPPAATYGRVVVRRPVIGYARPPFMMKPPMKLHRRPPMMSKKPYYRPLMKGPMTVRPIMVRIPNKFDKPMILALPSNPRNVVLTKPHIRNQVLMPEIAEPHVEISAQQPSTEREPGLVTAKPIAAKEETRHKPYVPLYPAVNTGFNPASVVIESGFKPIITKDIERRFVDEPEVEIESEAGVIDETKEPTENAQKATEFFEPMFIPSPTINDQMKRAQLKNTKPKKSAVRYYLKRGRRTHEDEVPAANERVESYYLPPDNNKAKPVERPKFRSNIDVPPGTVVTYDGKKLSGASLTVRTGEHRSVLEGRTSKAAELIKARPQFVPFRGELPPLDAKSINYDAPQLQSRGLNRDLDTPEAPGSTKLKRVSPSENRSRNKREAHHTEEHTAQQEREKEEYGKSSAYFVQITHFTIFTSVLFTCILKL